VHIALVIECLASLTREQAGTFHVSVPYLRVGLRLFTGSLCQLLSFNGHLQRPFRSDFVVTSLQRASTRWDGAATVYAIISNTLGRIATSQYRIHVVPNYAVYVPPYGGAEIPPELQNALSESKAALKAKQDEIERLL